MSNKLKIRYTGPPTTIYSYTNEFVVECPRCKHAAVITTDGKPYDITRGRVRCEHCRHSETSASLIRYFLIVNRHCNGCGKRLETKISGYKRKVPKILLSCPACGEAETFTPVFEEYLEKYPDTGFVNDPIFNLPLWLQSDFKGDVFWALNRRHLMEIKSYVASDLRERQTMVFTTMVEKLPHFIKTAKNRDAILKMIERLERKGI